jgi:pyruvate ferredoxin oxidoreductase alpha subunit
MNKIKPQFLEGSRAIAVTIANLDVDVISAYPITPQTHIVEDLALFKAENKANYEFIKAESEFAAASILVGASAVGGRTYSATSSQGVLLMMEVLYNAAGLRLPIVMTIANRSVSAPINIFNDHSDAMAMKDSGWLMLFAENHQEAVNLHILAYKLAEQLELPVAVNVDGFIITHSHESVSIPDRKFIKSFLPPYRPAPYTYLNSKNPISLGGFFSPKHYSQSRRELSEDIQKAQALITKEHKAWQKIFSQAEKKAHCFNNGLIEYCGPKKPEKILIAMGSVCGTIKEVLKKNQKVGLIKIISFRPLPIKSLNKIIPTNCQLAILEKNAPLSTFGSLYTEIIASLANFKGTASNHIIGLGGEDISEEMIQKIINLDNKKEVKFW